MVGLLQLPTLGLNSTRIEFYLKKAKERGCRVLLFGEYIINPFFKELQTFPISMIKEQTNSKIEFFKKLSHEFDITLVVPIIEVKADKFYKKIAKISPKSINYYTQQILINYNHWNEEAFFANPIKELQSPLIFTIDGFKIAIMYGFEIHFDKLWEEIHRKRVDLVLIPTASTFESKNRWRELLKTRAFLNNCYIMRANRVGEYKDSHHKWRFYGDSMFISPDGEVLIRLEDRESMLIEPISKEELRESRRGWGFGLALRKRGEL